MKQLDLPTLAATEALAARTAALAHPGDAILLEGPLGAGKTAFARAFLRAAAGDPALEVPSPSFTLVQTYDTPRCRGAPLRPLADRRAGGARRTRLGRGARRHRAGGVAGPARRAASGRRADACALTPALVGETRGAVRHAPAGRSASGHSHEPPAPPCCSPPASARACARSPTHGQAAAGAGRAHPARPRARPPGDGGGGEVVVNVRWHAEQVAAHLAARAGGPRTVLRREEALLDTGGSVAAALEVLGPDPFYVINGDTFWLDGPTPALTPARRRLGQAERDAVLLVHRTFQIAGGNRSRRFRPRSAGPRAPPAPEREMARSATPASSSSARRCSPRRRRGGSA